jgi:hypothetical protein
VQAGFLDHFPVIGESVRNAILLSYLVYALAVAAADGDQLSTRMPFEDR